MSCKNWTAVRVNEICRTLEREMEWTWTGHAIVSPSFRVTFETVRKTYCALALESRDTAAFVSMVLAIERNRRGSMAQAQLLNAARFLLYLLGSEALRASPENDKNWNEKSRVIAKTLRKEIALNASDAGIGNPLIRDICCAKAVGDCADCSIW